MAWLIHELTHGSQYEHVGSWYLAEEINAPVTSAMIMAVVARWRVKNLHDFNPEQQGDIIKDYYINVLNGFSYYEPDYKRMLQQLINGEL